MKPRIYRTIRPGDPKAARAARQRKWTGHMVAVRYYIDDETGETWKTVEIRQPPRNKDGSLAAADLRRAVREHCAECGDWWECYRTIRRAIGLSRSHRERDSNIVASEFRKMREGKS